MKKNDSDKHSRQLLFEFLKFGLLIFIWICFLIYHIARIEGNPSQNVDAVRLTVFLLAVLVGLIVLSGSILYRQVRSYIRWYQGILDSMPLSVVAIDKDTTWRQANKMARKLVSVKEGQSIEELNSRHLIGDDGSVLRRIWLQGAEEYRVAGNHLCVDGKDVGHVLLFYNMSELISSNGTRAELIGEINRLLGQLSVASVSFDDYASSLAECTRQQAGIICELSDVIVGIASGSISVPDELNEKMGIVKADMQRQVESSLLQIDRMRKTVGDMLSVNNTTNGVLRDNDNVP